MKKIACVIVIVLVLSVSFAAAACAEFSEGEAEVELYQEGKYYTFSEMMLMKDYDYEKAALINGIKNMNETVDLSFSTIRLNDFKELFREIVNDHPEFIYVDSGFSYAYSTTDSDLSNPIVYRVRLKYTMSEAQAEKRLALMEEEAEFIINNYITDGMTDFDKALAVHDYFAMNCEYDTTLKNHRADHILVDRTGVCEAYSLAYRFVLDKLDIECDYASSEEMNHIWNMVKLGNLWYHVDITWDDPVPDLRGRVLHRNFLIDDETFKTECGHYGWKSKYSASDDKYVHNTLSVVQSGIVKYDSKYFYLDADGNLICTDNYDAGTKTIIFPKTGYFICSDAPSSYKPNMSFLTVTDGSIYFTQTDGIYKLPYKNGSLQASKIISLTKYPIGINLDGDKIRYSVGAVSVNSGIVLDKGFAYSKSCNGLYGDINSDNQISMGDAVSVAKEAVQLQGMDENIKKLVDVNQDGKITMADAVGIARYAVSGVEF